MADKAESTLFRKSALNRLSSADDLDIFLKVSNPSAWIAVGAFLALIAGLLVWALTAVVPVQTTVKALVGKEGTATCWVDADLAEKLRASCEHVSIGGVEATGVAVGTRPMSSGEIRDAIGGGSLADELELGEWNYEVDLEFSEVPYGYDATAPYLAPVQVVYAMEHPIQLVFGN